MKTLVLLILPTLILGCRSMETLKADRRAGERGTEEVYKTDFSSLWTASKQVLAEAGSGAIDEDQASKQMFTTFPMSFWSYGTITAVYFQEDPAGCKVGVISRRKMPTNIVTSMSESGFHEALRAKTK